MLVPSFSGGLPSVVCQSTDAYLYKTCKNIIMCEILTSLSNMVHVSERFQTALQRHQESKQIPGTKLPCQMYKIHINFYRKLKIFWWPHSHVLSLPFLMEVHGGIFWVSQHILIPRSLWITFMRVLFCDQGLWDHDHSPSQVPTCHCTFHSFSYHFKKIDFSLQDSSYD